MKILRSIDPLLATTALCLGGLSAALYCQHVLGWAPCPLCIMQRLGLLAALLFALLGWFGRARLVWRRFCSVATASCGVATAAVAAYHLWVLNNPTVSCGIDPLETAINEHDVVQKFAWLLQADGLCTTHYPPVLGLPLAAWALLLGLAAMILGALAWHKRATTLTQ